MNLATMERRSDGVSRQRRRSFAVADEPLGYVDGPNVYGVERENPVGGADPNGLADGVVDSGVNGDPIGSQNGNTVTQITAGNAQPAANFKTSNGEILTVVWSNGVAFSTQETRPNGTLVGQPTLYNGVMVDVKWPKDCNRDVDFVQVLQIFVKDKNGRLVKAVVPNGNFGARQTSTNEKGGQHVYVDANPGAPAFFAPCFHQGDAFTPGARIRNLEKRYLKVFDPPDPVFPKDLNGRYEVAEVFRMYVMYGNDPIGAVEWKLTYSINEPGDTVIGNPKYEFGQIINTPMGDDLAVIKSYMNRGLIDPNKR